MNLIASNVLSIIVLSGLLLNSKNIPIDSIGKQSAPGLPSLCSLAEGATALVTTSSILSVLVIGIDQYLAVVDPLRYRTRIDKFKCALLILGVWLLALLFGIFASFNPEPRTLCSVLASSNDDETQSLSFQATLSLNDDDVNDTSDIEIDGVLRADDAETSNPAEIYGTLYAVTYALLGYLVPFVGICWIYVSIYLAARNNSERTRRTGSRPILTSGSFSDESSCGHKASYEDIRTGKMPKRSSLSSIDERSEATQSQLAYQENVDVQDAPGVVFTLGNSKLQIDDETKIEQAKDTNEQQFKVPISALKAQFLTSDSQQPQSAEMVRSKFPEVSDKRRKSSHDLLYDDHLPDGHIYNYDDDDDDEDEDDDDEHFSDEEEAIDIATFHHHHHHHHHHDVEEALPSLSDERHSDHSHQEGTAKLNNFNHKHPLPPIVTITPPGHKSSSNLHRAPSASRTNVSHSYINNIKHKISNGSLFKYREETRAARISVLVVFMGFICWSPYVYLLVERNLPIGYAAFEVESSCGLKMDTVALGFLVLATYLSPLLFGYRSRRIKRELRKFFCFKRELSYKNNRSLMAKKVLRRRHSGATILDGLDTSRYNIFSCINSGRNKWPKDKVQFVQVPDTALAVETCRSSFSSGASTQISSTSTDEC